MDLNISLILSGTGTKSGGITEEQYSTFRCFIASVLSIITEHGLSVVEEHYYPESYSCSLAPEHYKWQFVFDYEDSKEKLNVSFHIAFRKNINGIVKDHQMYFVDGAPVDSLNETIKRIQGRCSYYKGLIIGARLIKEHPEAMKKLGTQEEKFV